MRHGWKPGQPDDSVISIVGPIALQRGGMENEREKLVKGGETAKQLIGA